MTTAARPSRAMQARAVQSSGRNAGVLQRHCACGQHTIGGGGCVACKGTPQSVRDVTQAGLSGAGGILPHLDRIQSSFGPHHDLTRVRAHADGKAAEAAARIGARAYASGARIAFAGAPSLHTAAHEAAHVIQQRAGVCPPGGVGRVGDPYERHADAVASRVVQRQSSEDLLAPYAATRSGSAEADAVQLSAQNTFYGKLTDTIVEEIDDKKEVSQPGVTIKEKEDNPGRGVRTKIVFEPGVAVDATKIAMVQSVRRTSGGKALIGDPTQRNRIVQSGAGEGYRLDRAVTSNNPVFGSLPLKPGKGLADTPVSDSPTPGDPGMTYETGYRYFDNSVLKKKEAFLDDSAKWDTPGPAGMAFETTAVAIEGKQTGTYYGSVSWGWEIDANNVLKILEFKKVSDGTPSPNVLAPTAKWNASTARGTIVTQSNPTQVYRYSSQKAKLVPVFTIGVGIPVTINNLMAVGQDSYQWAVPTDPTLANKAGYINVSDLADKGDGAPTVNLPVPAAAQPKPDSSNFALNGITEIVGQDPESLLKLDTVTAVVFGTNDADSMALLTDLSDLARELAAKPQRVGFQVLSVNLEAAGNEKAAERVNKKAGQQSGPQLCIYIERSREKVLQGYRASYKREVRSIIGDASTSGAVKGLKWGATFGAIAGGIAGAIIGGVIGAKTGNAAGGSLLGSVLGGALGSAAGVGVGAAIGHVAGDDIGRDPAGADDVKKIQAFLNGQVPDRDLDHALAVKIVDYWLDNPKDGSLAIFQRQTLIKSMMAGYTGDPEERAILKIIENSSDQDLLQIFALSDENAPSMLALEAEFDGSEKEYLHKLFDRLRARFPVDAPLQKTGGLLIANADVQAAMAAAFNSTHKQEPDKPPVVRECGGVFLTSTTSSKIEHRGACAEGTDSDVGGIARKALKDLGTDYTVVGSYHTHPLTVPPSPDGKAPAAAYPKAAREAPSGADFKSFRQDPVRGTEHYVVGQYATYLITRDGGFRVLGNTADLLHVKRFTPPAGQRSTLEIG